MILNHDRKRDLLRCVESTLALRDSPFELVVVDNGSQDGSWEALREAYPEVQGVRSERNLGSPSGRNLGLRYADAHFRYRYLLFLDEDTSLDPSLLRELVAALEADPGVGIACPKAYREAPSRELMSVGMSVNFSTGSIRDLGAGETDVGQYDAPRDVDACGAFGFLMRGELARALGGFDEAFSPYGWADVDLCLRARRRGARIRYVPSARIHHKGGREARGFVPTYERYKARNFFWLVGRHANPLQWLSCGIFTGLRTLRRAAGLLLRGELGVVGSQMRGIVDAFARR